MYLLYMFVDVEEARAGDELEARIIVIYLEI